MSERDVYKHVASSFIKRRHVIASTVFKLNANNHLTLGVKKKCTQDIHTLLTCTS